MIQKRTVRKGDVMKRDGMLLTFAEFDRVERIEKILKGKIDHSTWFYKNCKTQRRRGAKICNSCPFRVLIEATE